MNNQILARAWARWAKLETSTITNGIPTEEDQIVAPSRPTVYPGNAAWRGIPLPPQFSAATEEQFFATNLRQYIARTYTTLPCCACRAVLHPYL